MFFADANAIQNLPPTITIGTVETLLGIAAMLIMAGVAWGSLKSSVKHIADSVKRIDTNITDMTKSMTDHESAITGLKVHTKYGVTNSPVQPSDEGKRLLEVSGFDTQYPMLKDKIFAAMDAAKLRTLYDYEAGAYDALKELKDDPAMDPLKDYAVNNPQEPLELIFKVASWVIRDDYNDFKNPKKVAKET